MMWNETDILAMQTAIGEAEKAKSMGEIPVGAVLTDEKGMILSAAGNRCEHDRSATSHAELLTILQAAKNRSDWRLCGTTLYVTLEPCPMCMGAIINSRISRVVFAAKDPRMGAAGSLINLCNYPLEAKPKVENGLLKEESLSLLKSFFEEKRKQK